MAYYHITAKDLRLRQKSLAPIVSRLASLETERVAQCNVCGSRQSYILARTDRYGLPFRTAMCANCGLVYQVDRFSEDSYNTFYRQYYRKLVATFNGAPWQDIAFIESEQRKYASLLIDSLAGLIPSRPDMRILDIGGSTGVVAEAFQRAFGGHATVVDPAPEELAAARNRELTTVESTFETWSGQDKYDVILLCRSIEHLQNLSTTLLKIREMLSPNGLFFCDIADYMATCRSTGPTEAVSKVDHCFWLSVETATRIFGRLGHTILTVLPGSYSSEVGFLLQRGEIVESTSADPTCLKLFVELQTIRADWEAFCGQTWTFTERVVHPFYVTYRRVFPKPRT